MKTQFEKDQIRLARLNWRESMRKDNPNFTKRGYKYELIVHYKIPY